MTQYYMEVHGAKKYRQYIESMVNVLGFNPKRNSIPKSETFDRIMAFNVIDMIAHAPDWWFDDRNETSRTRCRQIIATMSESVRQEISLDRNHFSTLDAFCGIFCKEELPKMHRTLQQSYIAYLFARICQSENPICPKITKQMEKVSPYWASLPMV